MRAAVLLLFTLALGCTTGGRRHVDASVDAYSPPDAYTPPPVDSGPIPDGGPRLDDVLIYAHSRDTLYTFSAYTNTVTEVAAFHQASGTAPPYMDDLAVDADGNIFASSDESLWRIDPETALATEIGAFDLGGDQLFALTFLAREESPDGSEMLVGATNAGVYYEIDRTNASTNYLGQYPDGWRSSGDLVSIAGLGTYATVRREDYPDSDVLARITFAADGSSEVMVIGPVVNGDQGFREVFGLGYWGRNLFGFTNAGQLIRIDRTTGAATVVEKETGAAQFWGAGVTTMAPFLI